MDFRKHGYSVKEAKEMDMVGYLSILGHEPAKIRNTDYWYLSPLRDERKPSFKVNRKLNRWYDHGLGRGGNLLDFAILYHNCSVGEFLRKINGVFSFQKPSFHQARQQETEKKINVIKDFKLTSFALLRYLEQRRIPIEIAERFCSEVHYELNGKTYYGIGFKNNSGGYEIRNPYFKASSSPKDLTTIESGAKEASVFEGFTDFLSFMSIHKNRSMTESDFVVLNSVSFFEKARPFMERHETVRLYLDRDTAGRNCSMYALSLSNKYKDESRLYQNYKDINDWTVNFGRPRRKKLGNNL